MEVARAIAGAQAQDEYAGPLTFRSRSRRLTTADVDRARTEDRSLLRTWLMRKTVHLIPTDDAGWMLPLFEPGIEKWSRRRLEQLGMPPRAQEKALREIARALDSEGPITRSEMGDRLAAKGIESDTQTRGHLVGLAITSGLACLGPDKGARRCLVRREEWLGELPPFDREAALGELARRYLRAFGPATERDFAYWSGLGLREVRAGLGAIGGEMDEVRTGEETLVSMRGEHPRLPRSGHVRLLGAFDTYMLGYKSRDFAVPPEGVAVVKEGGGGWIRPVIVRDGTLIGGWSAERKEGRIEISLNPLQPLPAGVRKAIDAEVADIGRFEGVAATLVDD